MTYITTRNNRCYVVAYDGIDPATGRERRRWHAVGRSRADAEAIANSLSKVASGPALGALDGMTLVEFLTDNWLNERQHRVRPTTAARYRWIIDHYIAPTVGTYRLRSIRTEHLDGLYANLSAGGGRDGRALASKTVHEVHLIVASALRDAHCKGLVRDNVAADAACLRESR
jgi:integrase